MERRALGKGLKALIPEKGLASGEKIVYLSVSEVRPNKYQPRETFNAEKQKELIASIKEKGVVQPILVRPCVAGGYELIAGERRLRAVKTLAIAEIPAIIKTVNDLEALELSLIENLQRQELNPIEEAHSYNRLMDEFNFTQDKIAEVIGRDRATIANTIRLLKLPKKIQDYVSSGDISMGHARALISLSDEKTQLKLCERIVKQGLSVRAIENVVSKPGFKLVKKRPQTQDQYTASVEEELQRIFQTRVRILHGRKRGRISIEYYSKDDLERILSILRRR